MSASPDVPIDPSGLKGTTARGFLWTMGQTVVVRLLSLVGFVVLARLLTPAEYGLAALASIFSVLIYMIGVAGMGQALVQRAEVDRTDLDTVFWFGTGFGLVLALGLSAAAWPLAAVFDEPELRPVLQVLSIGLVFIGLGSTQKAVLTRRLQFKAMATATVVANVIATIVGIIFAFAGFGVYALVIQSLLAPVIYGITNSVQARYRPGRNVSLSRFLELFAYSRNVLGTQFLGFVNTRTDNLLIGTTLGSTALGIYAVAFRLLSVMLDVLATTTRSVAFPVFSRMQDDRARLARAYSSAARMAGAVAFPCFAFILVTAPLIVPTVFGEQWRSSVPVMQVLCLFGPGYAVMQFNNSLLNSLGRARLVFRLGLIGTGLQVVLFVVAVRFGIVWVAAAFVLREYLMAPVALHAAAHELNSSVSAHLRGLVPAFASALLMVAVVYVVQTRIGDSLPGLVEIALLAAVAAPAYLGCLRLIGAEVLDEAVGYLRSALANRSATAGRPA